MFTITLAAFILKERAPLSRWGVILLGYIGVLFFTKNGSEWSFQLAIGIALLSNFFASLSIIFTKKLTTNENPLTLVALPFFAITVVTGLLNTYEGWTIPSLQTLLILVGIGGAQTFAQYAYVKALNFCDASFAGPFEYLRLVVAIPVGYFYFSEALTTDKLIGVSIILLSSFYLIKGRKA